MVAAVDRLGTTEPLQPTSIQLIGELRPKAFNALAKTSQPINGRNVKFCSDSYSLPKKETKSQSVAHYRIPVISPTSSLTTVPPTQYPNIPLLCPNTPSTRDRSQQSLNDAYSFSALRTQLPSLSSRKPSLSGPPPLPTTHTTLHKERETLIT